jgi:DNA (cytosine-5)-methyltransferase 1
MPIKEKMGFTFRRFIRALEKRGYKVEDRERIACDYGAPTAASASSSSPAATGKPIVWPAPTHGAGC